MKEPRSFFAREKSSKSRAISYFTCVVDIVRQRQNARLFSPLSISQYRACTCLNILWVVLLGFTQIRPAFGVSLIAGVPNAETTTKNMLMLATESQFIFQTGGAAPSVMADPKSWAGFHFATFGVSDHFELASTIYNSTYPSSRRIAVSLGYKWVDSISVNSTVFTNWKFLLGQEFLYGVESREGFGVWSFAGISNILQLSETRFTLGVSYGTRQMFGREVLCAFAGIEQPVSKKFSFIADWFSGTHDLAALITALQYKPTNHFVMISGPKWANNVESGSHAWMIELTLEI